MEPKLKFSEKIIFIIILFEIILKITSWAFLIDFRDIPLKYLIFSVTFYVLFNLCKIK